MYCSHKNVAIIHRDVLTGKRNLKKIALVLILNCARGKKLTKITKIGNSKRIFAELYRSLKHVSVHRLINRSIG